MHVISITTTTDRTTATETRSIGIILPLTAVAGRPAARSARLPFGRAVECRSVKVPSSLKLGVNRAAALEWPFAVSLAVRLSLSPTPKR